MRSQGAYWSVTSCLLLALSAVSRGQLLDRNHELVTGSDAPMICSVFRAFGQHPPGVVPQLSMVEGAILPFSSRFTLDNETCSGFLGWEAYQQIMAIEYSFGYGAINLPASLEVFNRVGFIIRDTCSSNLLAASHSQTILSVRRSDLPAVSVYGDGNMLIRDLDLNLTRLASEAVQCTKYTRGTIHGCMALRDLLEIASDPDLEERNETLRDLARFVTNGVVAPSDVFFSSRDNDRVAPSSMLISLNSREAIAISPVLSAQTVVHISAWASSPTFNNVNEYPYFFRMSPSDDHQVSAIVDLLSDLEATYIALIAGDDDLYSGQGFNMIRDRSRREQAFCIAVQARISATEMTSLTDAAAGIAANPLARVIVLFATPEQVAAFIPVYNSFNITDRIIIGSSDWFNRLDYSIVPVDTDFYNTVTFGFIPSPELIFEDLILPLSLFNEYLNSHYSVGKVASDNAYVRFYLQQVSNCTIPANISESCQNSMFAGVRNDLPECTKNSTLPSGQLTIAPLTVFMVRTLVRVVLEASVIQPYCVDGSCVLLTAPVITRHLLDTYRALQLTCSLRGVRTMCRVFTPEQSGYPFFELRTLRPSKKAATLRQVGVGDWNGAGSENSGDSSEDSNPVEDTFRTRLQWYNTTCIAFHATGPCINMSQRRAETFPTADQSGASSTASPQPDVPQSICSPPCNPGSFRRVEDSQQFCCWTCTTCATGSVSSGENEALCELCPAGLVANVGRTQCITPIIYRWPWPSYWTLVLLLFSLLGCVVSTGIWMFFIKHRKEAVILKSNMVHMSIVMASANGLFLSIIILLFVSRATTLLCHVQSMAVLLFTASSMSAVLFKTNRLTQIFKSMSVLGSTSGKLKLNLLRTEGQVFLIIVTTLLVCIFYLVLRVTLPREPVLIFIDEQRAAYACDENPISSSLLLAVFVLSNLLASYLAFQTRSLPDDYNDSKLIMFTAGISSMILLSFLPALLNTDLTLRTVVMFFILIAYHYTVVLTLCLPRIYWSKFGFTENYRRPATHSSGRDQSDDRLKQSVDTPTTTTTTTQVRASTCTMLPSGEERSARSLRQSAWSSVAIDNAELKGSCYSSRNSIRDTLDGGD